MPSGVGAPPCTRNCRPGHHCVMSDGLTSFLPGYRFIHREQRGRIRTRLPPAGQLPRAPGWHRADQVRHPGPELDQQFAANPSANMGKAADSPDGRGSM